MEDKNGVRKGYHCAWQIHYHIVFPVKYRKVLLDKGIIEIIKETAIGIQERYEMEIEAMGMDRDHVHILCIGHPKLSPGQIVRIFKSITAREIFRRRPEVKKELWCGDKNNPRLKKREGGGEEKNLFINYHHCSILIFMRFRHI